MGKYQDVVKDLPRFISDKPEYQARVDLMKATIRADFGTGAAAMAALYRSLKTDEDVLKEQEKQLNLKMEATRQLIGDVFEAEGIHSLSLGEGGLVYTQPEPYAQYEDKEAYRNYCLGSAALAPMMMVPWQTTNAMLKERLLNGDAPEPGIKAFVIVKVVCRK